MDNVDNIGRCQIKIDRPIYEHDQLRLDYDYSKCKSNKSDNCVGLGETTCKKLLFKTIPSIEWLSHYRWKRNFLSDVISGITVAIMHIPQGMAYGMLGNVPPVVGIYMAFFPVIIYFFLGTSRHTSMGTFAIVCLMTGKTVLEHSHSSFFDKNTKMDRSEQNSNELPEDLCSPIQVATAVTFTVALFQLAMYTFRLGIISALLSETLVSGFITGAAFQVVVSQIKDLLGLDIPRHKGFFVVINTLISVFEDISATNLAAATISFITIFISILNNELLKPIVAKKSPFPVPIELIAIVIGTLVSSYCNLDVIYGIKTVGDIPSGLPEPQIPSLSLVTSLLVDGFIIAVVSYTITLSMALIFAQKLNYEVDANQELLALGAGNIFGSFFSCMPFTASLSRSTIQQVVGGKTQIASIVSCSLLLIVMLWIGPLFEPLPKCVLASVIVVALKGMLMEVRAFYKFWKLSKMDAAVWMATFLTVIFVSIEIGLLIGVILSLVTIFVLSLKPYTCLLGSVPHTDIYIDINRYKGAVEVCGLKIFHYCGGINFATRNVFKSELFRFVDINPQKELQYRTKLMKFADEIDVKTEECSNEKVARLQRKINRDLKCLILDFSSVSHIDPSGVSTLDIVVESFKKIDIPVYIAACSEPVYGMILKCGLLKQKQFVRTFPTVHDATECAIEIFTTNASNISTISRS